MKKLIALDVDGTLVNSNHVITEKTKNTLLKCQKEGHILVIASGRDVEGVKDLAEDLEFDTYNGLLSNYNGCRVTDFATGQVLFNHTFKIDQSNEIISFVKNLDVEIFTFKDGKVYSDDKNNKSLIDTTKRLKIGYLIDKNMRNGIDFLANNMIIGGSKEKIDQVYPIVQKEFESKYTVVRTTANYVEFMPKGFSKGSSLLEIAKYYKIDKKNIIAFGDEENDYSMFDIGAFSVAMGNASEKIKEKADFVTKSNDEDGIAYYLENYLLK
ncbi:Cof-type HAD-IIB family hydrolase [Anaerococcus hydrogenalis]|uniref:Cof-type HAD-IIB family hydrolase n=1 Tax=Anaerococcus hydrogenalis TaxID=33029 RepID=A0A2N6UII6_9FIRM|nr:Cof-type HAD-IIB family hydrolase [Anaerococcus hydrogenalis]MDK7694842.1 Cof-type HAD-IIB family hydrolase [Anaerococcus hydrogenalis]MDK7696604.1 Cof-type HAD-IIB family hydrolase [Anaerococcus hydrogenalis]MDK7707869.1 Cof-type HAD-IIB family hydrolase [Anaerococcus hydrogenalis]PMC81478.1 Cof-type HAD-IIB family hydrolase [Anaerococcus hydrogenalis]